MREGQTREQCSHVKVMVGEVFDAARAFLFISCFLVHFFCLLQIRLPLWRSNGTWQHGPLPCLTTIECQHDMRWGTLWDSLCRVSSGLLFLWPVDGSPYRIDFGKCLWAAEESGKNDGPEDLILCLVLQAFVAPNTFVQPTKWSICHWESVVNFFVNPCIRWDDAAQVSIPLCWFQFDQRWCGVIGDLLGDWLVMNLSFPEADFKAKQPLDVHKARCDEL